MSPTEKDIKDTKETKETKDTQSTETRSRGADTSVSAIGRQAITSAFRGALDSLSEEVKANPIGALMMAVTFGANLATVSRRQLSEGTSDSIKKVVDGVMHQFTHPTRKESKDEHFH